MALHLHLPAVIQTQKILEWVKGAISASGITTNIGDSSFSIVKSSGTLSVQASDGFGNQVTSVKDEVQNFSDLPKDGINNQVVEVVGDASNTFDNYYVKYNSTTKVWEETVEPGIKVKLDPTQCLMFLLELDGNFRFTQVDGSSYKFQVQVLITSYGDRKVGDLDSAPNPSFVDRKLETYSFIEID